ncbi:MAG: calcium-binding protein [Planctomycetes bacterium]|nr:calcium-binding protein [Planctomycetota bacterium]MBI3845027.1 calcium-binding protein [Planctomycetota bacterium]
MFRISAAMAWLVSPIVWLVASGAVAQTVTRVSADSSGVQGNDHSTAPILSADGRFVVFGSSASNLVPDDTNDAGDVFVHDRLTGRNEIVSVASGGVQVRADIRGVDISADGRFVLLYCSTDSLDPADTNRFPDAFVHDRQTLETTLVSVGSSGVQGNDASAGVRISADGRFVAFVSLATNLVPGDTNARQDLFVHDRQTGQTTRENLGSGGVQSDEGTSKSDMSDDGRFVVFESSSTYLVPGDTNSMGDIFVHDSQTNETVRVSTDSAGNEGNLLSFYPSISGDGRFVAFISYAENLVPGDTNRARDGFVHDLQTGRTVRVDVNSAGAQSSLTDGSCVISRNGRFVLVASRATDLAQDNGARLPDLFVHDLVTGQTTCATVNSVGYQPFADNAEEGYAISGDGRFVAFASVAPNFVSGDTNGKFDIFVRPMLDPSECRAGVVGSGVGSIADVLFVNGSAGDANRVVTASTADPIQVALNASPAGPGGPGNPIARYHLWMWSGFPSNPYELKNRTQLLGCTVNPTPFITLAQPQPFRCLRGTGLPPTPYPCAGPSPARAPWAVSRAAFGRPMVVTFQGVLEDLGAANSSHFSVTNAVILKAQ